MLQSLALLGVKDVHLDLGHVGVFRALISHAKISKELENELFAALQSKDSASLQTLAPAAGGDSAQRFAGTADTVWQL